MYVCVALIFEAEVGNDKIVAKYLSEYEERKPGTYKSRAQFSFYRDA